MCSKWPKGYAKHGLVNDMTGKMAHEHFTQNKLTYLSAINKEHNLFAGRRRHFVTQIGCTRLQIYMQNGAEPSDTDSNDSTDFPPQISGMQRQNKLLLQFSLFRTKRSTIVTSFYCVFSK